jgi:hypothetical protein
MRIHLESASLSSGPMALPEAWPLNQPWGQQRRAASVQTTATLVRARELAVRAQWVESMVWIALSLSALGELTLSFWF